ncbi:MAG TPA: D-alanyl-D-alanine carboxypeptidase family protein [Bacillota bacterium]|nr:D-alanyl-D-alanine carboxypeptidase family protein [Bacillota bacterium]
MQRRISLFFSLMLVLSLMFYTIPTEAAAAPLNIQAESAILLDAATGQILFQQNVDEPRPPASMTKMMTEYLVLEAIHKGKVKWEDKISNTPYGFFMAKKGDSSVIGLGENETRTVAELYDAMAIYSANDATVVLAEHIGGSEANFVKMMNDKAKEFGMNNTRYFDSTGYPVKDLGEYGPQGISDDQHVMSARDTAILASHLIADYPESLEHASVPQKKFRAGEKMERLMKNYNWMLPGLVMHYQGVDGLKTGYIDIAGYCFTSTAKRGDERLVSVVMGTKSELARFQETRKLLDYGFNNFHKVKVLESGATIPAAPDAKVDKGVKETVPVTLKDDLTIMVPSGEEKKMEVNASVDPLTAPVKKDQVVGHVTLKSTGAFELQYLQAENTGALVAKEDVEKASSIRLFFRSIIDWVTHFFHKG